MQAARRARDDEFMGRKAREVLGDVAELPAWNAALLSLGERYREVRNREASEQAQSLLADAKPTLRALAHWIAKSAGRAELFLELEKAHSSLRFPVTWTTTWWQVPLSAVCETVADSFVAAGVAEESVSSLRSVLSLDSLRERLEAQGVLVDVRPFETAAANLLRLKSAMAIVHDVYAIWKGMNQNVAAGPLPDTEKRLPVSAYIDLWDDDTALGHAVSLIADPTFTAACVACHKAEDLPALLGTTKAEVEKRQHQRQVDLAEAARKKRTFEVAGSSFEFGKDDYGGLFERLRTSTSTAVGPDIKQDVFTPLGAPSQNTGGRGGSGSPGKSSHLRPSPETREMEGIVGEMLAYYFLRAKFGEDAVPREAWVSESRLKVLPLMPGENDGTSDGYGFDFRFRAMSKDWQVEVKATIGDEEEFELGISEIEAASRLADHKTKLWRILRVRQVFSATPQFDWLPNPFDSERRELFRMDRTGTRLHYVRKST